MQEHTWKMIFARLLVLQEITLILAPIYVQLHVAIQDMAILPRTPAFKRVLLTHIEILLSTAKPIALHSELITLQVRAPPNALMVFGVTTINVLKNVPTFTMATKLIESAMR